jgi:hypothetical protein
VRYAALPFSVSSNADHVLNDADASNFVFGLVQRQALHLSQKEFTEVNLIGGYEQPTTLRGNRVNT